MAGTRCPIQIDRAAGASADLEMLRGPDHIVSSFVAAGSLPQETGLRCPAMSEISTGRNMRARSRLGLLSEGLSSMVSVDGTYTVAAACGAQARIASTRFGSHL